MNLNRTRRGHGALLISAGSACTLLGVVTLIGWVFHIFTLTSFGPSSNPMVANSAVAFAADGVALIFIAIARPRAALGGAVWSLLAGILTLAEYGLSVGLGFDQMLVTDTITLQTAHPGRMAPNTAVGFLLVGLALWYASRPRSEVRRPTIIGVLGAVVLAIGTASVLGYVGGYPTYAWGNWTRMAANTAAGFMTLGFGIVTVATLGSKRDADAPTRWPAIATSCAGLTITLSFVYVLDKQLWTETDHGRQMFLFTTITVMGVLSSVVLGIMVNLALTSRRRAEALQAANEKLKKEICHRKRAEEKLIASEEAMRASEQRVHLLLDSTAEAIYGIDLTGKCTFANSACLRALGYPDLQALIGRNMHDLIHHSKPDGSPYPVKECRIFRAFQSGEGSHVDDEVLWRADGKSFPAEYWSFPVRKDGEVVGSVVAFLDITDRKRTEEALRGSEEKYRLLVANIPDVVWVADDEGHIVFATPNIQAIYGFTPEEIYGSGAWSERIHSQDAEHVREAYRRFLGDGPRFRTEYRIQRKDGLWIWFEAKAINHYELDGKRFTVGLASDITTRKQAAEELRTAKEAAEAGNRAKSRFLAKVSHEIRTPMNAVLGMTRLLLETNLSDQQRRYAEVVRQSGDMLMALVNDVLDLSKIEAGKMQLELVDFDVRVMLEGVIEMLAPEAARKGLELTCLVTPETPSHVRGDSGRLRQVIANLAANAVKFTARGEIAVRVQLDRDDGRRETLRFAVADTGIGISKERAGALFSPFVQADDSTTRRFGGTGLGLAISKQFVEMMGGEIGFESEEGAGSTFWFTAVLEKQPKRVEAPAGQAAGLRNMKALVVDNSTANRLAVCTMLRSWGCRASEAADASTALALLGDAAQAGDPFEIALLDTLQTGTTAEELAGSIRTDSRLTGLVLLLMVRLGTPDSDLCAISGETSPFAARIQKPILETHLREALQAACYTNKAVENAAMPISSESMPSSISARRKARILVADDNSINREVAVAVLKQLGYTASAVSNGSEAVEALKLAEFDLVLMDCEMPQIDGYEATRLIRDPLTGTLDSRIPIIAVTASAMPGDRERCLQAGMDDYLSKPIEPEEMAQTIIKWLTRSEPIVVVANTTAAAAVEVEAGFDPAGLLKRMMGDRNLAERVAKQVLEDIPVQLCNLRRYLEDGDSTGACRAAHTLKGAAATVSATGLRAVAFDAEQAARAGRLGDVTELLPRFEHQFERFQHALMLAGWA